ncbi:YqgE/AlgH family protein [Methylobacterium sp. J-088]|uniref:YqgE/AlgH family protein n=1 Tax=Methylobacterium sp. J-088 TaxID=2836664 RepID=UPI002441334C|nr:YqgE/AlgH family protein [Methylobacterium sp. J-088]
MASPPHRKPDSSPSAPQRESGSATANAANPAPRQTSLSGPDFLDGQFLVAMPGMADERFARSVIYVCAHSADGAMGIIVNKAATDISMPDLLVQLDVAPEADAIRLRERVGHMPVLMGGPVEGRRGFVLHTDDFHIQQSTLIIDDGICLTATVEILRAIASGEGPASAVLALGYAGWQAGQLESEIMANGWLNCPADPELIFNTDLDAKYERALRANGIDPAMLSMTAGRA